MGTAAIALLAAVLGAIVAGLFRERADREAQLRDRRLAAADDFLAAAMEVFVGLTAAVEQAPFPAPESAASWLLKMEGATNAARVRAHDVTRHASRIELLFGRDSPTSSVALQLTAHLLRMTGVLQQRQVEGVAAFEEAYNAAADEMAAFTTEAHYALARGRQWTSLVGGRRIENRLG